MKDGRWLPYRGVECHPRNRSKIRKARAYEPKLVVSQEVLLVRPSTKVKPVQIVTPSSLPENSRIADTLAWVESNKAEIESRLTEMSHNQRMRTNKKQGDYSKKRRREDPLFRITCLLRGRLRVSLNGGKKDIRTLELLGCSVAEFKIYIEGQFKSGMTWQNFGEWELDHKKPCASFNLTLPEHVVECFHWTNFQPLWKSENRQKSSTWKGVRWCRGKPIITV